MEKSMYYKTRGLPGLAGRIEGRYPLWAVYRSKNKLCSLMRSQVVAAGIQA